MSVHACVAVNVCHFRRNWRLLRKLLLQLQLFNKCLPYAFALKLAMKTEKGNVEMRDKIIKDQNSRENLKVPNFKT